MGSVAFFILFFQFFCFVLKYRFYIFIQNKKIKKILLISSSTENIEMREKVRGSFFWDGGSTKCVHSIFTNNFSTVHAFLCGNRFGYPKNLYNYPDRNRPWFIFIIYIAINCWPRASARWSVYDLLQDMKKAGVGYYSMNQACF